MSSIWFSCIGLRRSDVWSGWTMVCLLRVLDNPMDEVCLGPALWLEGWPIIEVEGPSKCLTEVLGLPKPGFSAEALEDTSLTSSFCWSSSAKCLCTSNLFGVGETVYVLRVVSIFLLGYQLYFLISRDARDIIDCTSSSLSDSDGVSKREGLPSLYLG